MALAIVGAAVGGPVAASGINVTGLAQTCNNCHGTDGISVGLSMPSIAGLPETYLKTVMMEWKSGERASASMTRLIKGFNDNEIAALAAHFSKLPWTPKPQTFAAALLEQGMDATGRCESCHGVTGSEPNDDDTPKLNGQWAKYLELELLKYKDPAFKMTHKKMIRSVRRVKEADIAPAAQYYGAQSK